MLWYYKRLSLAKIAGDIAVTLHDVGVCLRNNGRYDEAEEMLRRLIRL